MASGDTGTESEKDLGSSKTECPVCLTQQQTQNLLQTQCKHRFCKNCVEKLLTNHHPPLDVVHPLCPLCRQPISPYDTTWLGSNRSLAPRPATIYGAVYVQANTVGLASYHFSENESYISYSAAPPMWRLDDGTAPPVKKSFLQTTYDATSRTFRAVVDWSDVNFSGDAEWIYRMVFSEDFKIIERGEVVSYDSEGRKGQWHVYEQNLYYVRLEELDFNPPHINVDST